MQSSGKAQAKFGQGSGKFGQSSGKFGQSLGKVRASSGKVWAKFGQVRAKFGQVWAKFGQSWRKFYLVDHFYPLFVIGYHWLPLATIDLVGDNREFEVRNILWSYTHY